MRGSTFFRYVVAAAVGGAALGAGGPAAAAAADTPVLAYTFNQSGGTPADASGHGHALRTLAARGGAAAAVAHGTGLALQFPARCSGRKCPRVVLQTGSTDELNPGNAPFRYGATVLLAKKATSAGQNVLQKGYSHAGGQFKLQIDGAAGRPSCVLVGTGSRVLHVARSGVSVADGAWHRVECRRSGPSLAVLVDDVVRGTSTVPAELSVSNAAPVSIGGKGTYIDNDQFQGTLDDVWIAR